MELSSQHTKMNLCPNRESEKFEQLGEFSTKIENIFNPLVSGSDRFELWKKKSGGRKSRWTVPFI